MAGGALMQLVAYGAQDVYLTGSPSITFFQAVYKKHTNFAMETIEQTIDGTVGSSGHCSVTVARNGDLIGNMFLELNGTTGLDSAKSGLGFAAERAINYVTLTIGGQQIDKHYQKWWRLYSELNMDAGAHANYGKMTSFGLASVDNSDKVYLPLLFFFNRNPGLYLPLISLQYHEVKLDFYLDANFGDNFATNMTCYGNYVYLDTEERRRFAQTGHEYLIDQVQHTGGESVTVDASGVGVKQIRLSYNHPVKELVWRFGGSTAAAAPGAGTGDDYFATWCPQDVIDPPVTEPANAGNSTTYNLGAPTFDVEGSTNQWVVEGGDTNATARPAVGPLNRFKLILNGTDRFKEQYGKYFNQVQSFEHHSGSPQPGIYSYSFGLKPEEHQPTGTCNFSRIDNAVAWVEMKSAIAANQMSTMSMFAVNYNVLRVQSGMGGLAFSN